MAFRGRFPFQVCLLVTLIFGQASAAKKQGGISTSGKRLRRIATNTQVFGTSTTAGTSSEGTYLVSSSVGKGSGKGKGSRRARDQFECLGITNVVFLGKQELYELAADRLALEEDRRVELPDTIDALTLADAHALGPPRCHLAPVENQLDLTRLQTFTSGPSPSHGNDDVTGWTGVFKDLEPAVEDQSEDIHERRQGWRNQDGTSLNEYDDSLWNPNQPSKDVYSAREQIRNAAIFTNGALSSQSPVQGLDGAFYQCCSLFAFEDSGEEDIVGDLEDAILSLISI